MAYMECLGSDMQLQSGGLVCCSRILLRGMSATGHEVRSQNEESVGWRPSIPGWRPAATYILKFQKRTLKKGLRSKHH